MIYFNLECRNYKRKIVNSNSTTTRQISLPQYKMEEMKLSWLIGPHDKHIICNINNDIPVKISSHPYVLVNRSVLCNCGIEADNHFLLKSLAACENVNSKLTMHTHSTLPIMKKYVEI